MKHYIPPSHWIWWYVHFSVCEGLDQILCVSTDTFCLTEHALSAIVFQSPAMKTYNKCMILLFNVINFWFSFLISNNSLRQSLNLSECPQLWSIHRWCNCEKQKNWTSLNIFYYSKIGFLVLSSLECISWTTITIYIYF